MPAAWMMTRYALSQVTADPVVRERLPGSRVLQVLQPGQEPLTWADSVTVATFAAASDLERAVTSHQLPAGTGAVMYDPEAWSFTPLPEQHDPVGAATQAMVVAHGNGLTFLATPALNLTKVLGGGPGPRWQRFLRLGLAGEMARTADTVELQAQSLERDASIYAKFVQEAVAQARAANPRVSIFAGLSTNPPGTPVTSQQLIAAISATKGLVNGYWLNIPGKGPHCPTCNGPRPDIAIAVLRAVLP